MAKTSKLKKSAPPGKALPQRAYSAEAQEMRALLRRIPDGLKATLQALAARPQADRERVLTELARGMGKDILPLVRTAALGGNEELAQSAVRILPVFGTRAAGDVLVEVHRAHGESERA